MLRLFRAVSLREHRTHVGRALLIVAGVALIGYDLTFAFAGVRSADSLAVVLLMTAAAGWAAATPATRRPVLDDIRDQ